MQRVMRTTKSHLAGLQLVLALALTTACGGDAGGQPDREVSADQAGKEAYKIAAEQGGTPRWER